ncbi:unnamed protein product, partial [Laminaria digitata]
FPPTLVSLSHATTSTSPTAVADPTPTATVGCTRASAARTRFNAHPVGIYLLSHTDHHILPNASVTLTRYDVDSFDSCDRPYTTHPPTYLSRTPVPLTQLPISSPSTLAPSPTGPTPARLTQSPTFPPRRQRPTPHLPPRPHFPPNLQRPHLRHFPSTPHR